VCDVYPNPNTACSMEVMSCMLVNTPIPMYDVPYVQVTYPITSMHEVALITHTLYEALNTHALYEAPHYTRPV
jgi:hypothetical protein